MMYCHGGIAARVSGDWWCPWLIRRKGKTWLCKIEGDVCSHAHYASCTRYDKAMKKKLRDFIHNGEPIPSELHNSENGFLLTKIAGEYLDNDDHVRAMIALRESKKCHDSSKQKVKGSE